MEDSKSAAAGQDCSSATGAWVLSRRWGSASPGHYAHAAWCVSTTTCWLTAVLKVKAVGVAAMLKAIHAGPYPPPGAAQLGRRKEVFISKSDTPVAGDVPPQECAKSSLHHPIA
jgi:hypothetical protein